MIRHIGRSALVGLAGLVATAAFPAVAAQWCLDVERDTVAALLPSGCNGKVVGDEEANAVKARRLEQIRRAAGGSAPPPVAGGRRMSSIGTGFFITGDGKLLSNNHVVERCQEITVDTSDGRNLPARVVATAPKVDLALIDTAATPPAFASFRAGQAPVAGSDITLVGYPNQGRAPVQPLMTVGTLLGTDRPDPAVGVGSVRLAFKADVRHGNSGGPLFDQSGLVIGVVHAKLDSPKLYRETGRVVVDVGFAISAPVTAHFLERHGVRPAATPPGAALSPDAIQAQANRQVARVNCWQ